MKLRRVASVLAHPVTVGLISAASVFLARDKAGAATRVGVALPLGVLGSKLVKRAFPTRKPHWYLSVTPRESFPSGHSVAVAAAATAFADAARTRRYVPLALAAIGLVNAARVKSRQHRLREVIAGDAIGFAAAAIGSLVARRLA